MFEQAISVPSGGATLAGTLCQPALGGRFPLVLMVHGTGPLDRDANMPGQALNIFNTLAQALAAAGIASLRYDKRGCGQSSGDYNTASHHDLVADAAAWLTALRQREGQAGQPIFILGHSEGCLIAPQAAKLSPPVAGLALLCPFIEPIERVLLRQAATVQAELQAMPGLPGWLNRGLMRLLGEGPLEQQRKLIARIKTKGEASFRAGPQRIPANSLREMMAVDVAAIMAAIDTPCLLIGGAKDLQCDPQDVARISEVLTAPVESHVLPDLTHLLRRDPQPASLLGSAALVKDPLDAEVVELVRDWLLRQTAG